MANAEDWGKLLLRLAVGILILLHGIAKLRFGQGDVVPALERAHIPVVLGHLIYIGEVVAPIMMIVGFWTRPAALLVAATMAVALVLGHTNEIFAMTNHGGLLLEVQWMFLLAAIAVALLGAGRLAIGGEKGRWN